MKRQNFLLTSFGALAAASVPLGANANFLQPHDPLKALITAPDWAPYLDDFYATSQDPYGKHVWQKGRQTGFTEAIARAALYLEQKGESVLVIAPDANQTEQISQRLETNRSEYHYGNILNPNSSGSIVLSPALSKYGWISRNLDSSFKGSLHHRHFHAAFNRYMRVDLQWLKFTHVFIDEALYIENKKLLKYMKMAPFVSLIGTPLIGTPALTDLTDGSFPHIRGYQKHRIPAYLNKHYTIFLINNSGLNMANKFIAKKYWH